VKKYFTTQSAEETKALAALLLRELPGKSVFALYGGLGSGKTCFVQGMARALGITRPVTSPTFTIAREYKAARTLYHLDLYRMRDADEVLNIGFEDYARGNGVTAVEWAERAEGLLPEGTVRVYFAAASASDERKISVEYD